MSLGPNPLITRGYRARPLKPAAILADCTSMCSTSSCGSTPSEILTSSQISTAVARKVLDAQQVQGDAIVEMLSSAAAIAQANAELPARSASTGLGVGVDHYA